MGERSLLWRMVAVFLGVLALSMVGATWLGQIAVRGSALSTVIEDLEATALGLADRMDSRLAAKAPPETLCQGFTENELSLTVVDVMGWPLCDTLASAHRMENMARLPEIAAALAGRTGISTRRNRSDDQLTLTVAVPVGVGPAVHAVVSLTRNQPESESLLVRFRLQIILLAGLAGVTGLVFLALFARRLQATLQMFSEGSSRVTEGDFAHRWPLTDMEETQQLANQLNQMMDVLEDRFSGLTQGQAEMEAVLASMVEGVLAVDTEERILNLNRSAAELLEADLQTARGRYLLEAAPIPELSRFLKRVLKTSQQADEEIQLFREGNECTYQVQGAPLLDDEGEVLGALVVLHDLTRLRRLEGMRRNFVANVSHEMRTPLTAIRGWVENLLPIDNQSQEDIRHGLEVIERQSERMTAIVEDLLELSRIEQEEEAKSAELQVMPIAPVIEAAAQSCAVAAKEKQTKITVDCSPKLVAMIEPFLLERALINLLSNAIKYSPGETEVKMRCRAKGEWVELRVQDEGPGISPDHQTRIFERFYRVDRARSRQLGGTGLGLAIVRHTAQLHGGEALVESKQGKGSTFIIRLPKPIG